MDNLDALVNRIKAIRKKVEDAKIQKSKYEGSREAELKALKALGCNSVEEANAKIAEIDRTLPTMLKRLEDSVSQLEQDIAAIEQTPA